MEVTMAVAETTLGGTGERVRVFEEAPELLQQVGNGDAVALRQLTIGEATCAELRGGGDVLRPWTEIDSQIASIASETRWQVVMPSRVALLNARFALQICRWPSVTAAIIDRVVQR